MEPTELIARYVEARDFAQGVESPFFALLESFVEEHSAQAFRNLTTGGPKPDEHDVLVRIRAYRALIDHCRTKASRFPGLVSEMEAAGIPREG